MMELYFMLRATQLSVTLPSHALFSSLSGYHFSHQTVEIKLCTKYINMPVQQKKVISLLGKKNTGKKTPKEDSKLGYSDFSLTLTIHLPHPQQKGMQLSPMHKNLNIRVVGEANLCRKAPSIRKLMGPVP